MLSLTSSQIQSPGTCEVMMREMRIDIYKKDDCVKYYKRITPPLTLPPKKYLMEVERRQSTYSFGKLKNAYRRMLI